MQLFEDLIWQKTGFALFLPQFSAILNPSYSQRKTRFGS